MNLKAPTTKLRAICWALFMGLEHVQWRMLHNEKIWKEGMNWFGEGGSSNLGTQKWGSSSILGNTKIRILFHSWESHLADLGVQLQFSEQERGQLQVAIQWTRSFNKRRERKLILPLGSFSISTSFHLALHSLLCVDVAASWDILPGPGEWWSSPWWGDDSLLLGWCPATLVVGIACQSVGA